jgi:hypothetical protein
MYLHGGSLPDTCNVHVHVGSHSSVIIFIGIHETVVDGSSLVFQTTPNGTAECVAFEVINYLE